MKKAPLYSHSRQRSVPPARPTEKADQAPASNAAPSPAAPAGGSQPRPRLSRWQELLGRHRIFAAALAAAMLVLAGGLADRALTAPSATLTQKDIDAAVRHSLEKQPLPSAYAKAYAAVRPSVVRVVGLDDENDEPPKPGDDPKAHQRSTGTGVVIVDNGTILTNLHVVVGAKRIRVTFADFDRAARGEFPPVAGTGLIMIPCLTSN